MVVCLFVCSGCAATSSLFCLISDYVEEGHMAKPWLGWLEGSQKPRGRSSSFITMSRVVNYGLLRTTHSRTGRAANSAMTPKTISEVILTA